MKRSFLALSLSLLLMASLAACTDTPAGDKQDGGAAAERTRAEAVRNDGLYYATQDGRVAGRDDKAHGTNLASDARRIADDVARGARDLGRDAREMAYDVTHE